jgi:hypothetical protein
VEINTLTFPHPVLPHVDIHYLIRDVRDYHRPIHAQRISKYIKYIKSLMDLLPQSTGLNRLKARAIGATRAVLAGASVDDVIAHGNWSSRAIFEKNLMFVDAHVD